MNIINKKLTIILLCSLSIWGCNNIDRNKSSIVYINDRYTQDSLFVDLMHLTFGTISKSTQNDSLAFLILPVDASCPACREKTIDSIVVRKDNLIKNHFIVLSARGGRKTIGSFFRELDKELPYIPDRLFLDTINYTAQSNLCDEKPTMYYSYNRKVYKKVAAIPITVKEDLREFFSGLRNNIN
jgi:hypothetical protein